MSEFKVICVDDEQDILEYLEMIFQDAGHEVEVFTNPENALEYILKNKSEILMIFSDFQMPEMTGFELREKMLEKDVRIPFAIFTAYYNTEMAEQAMRFNICDFISKPCSGEKLLEVFNREVGSRLATINEEKEMIDGFLEETSPMLPEIEELILQLEEDPQDELAINTYFRLLHTIKGTASCLGLTELSRYAHKYEDLITDVKNKKLQVNQAVIDVLLKGYDYLSTMYECEKNRSAYPFQVDDIVSIFDQDFSIDEDVKASESKEKETRTTGEAAPAQTKESKKTEKEESINVPVSQLTEFLEFSGELTVLKNTIFKSLLKLTSKYSSDSDLENLSESIQEMHKVSSFLQTQVSEMKKVSVDSVFRPMKRVIRDSAKVCDKKVNFTTEGENLRVDTAIGKLLNNVLVHMLRNSVDHGIETPEVRAERGKTPEGNIELKCSETGEDIVVEITDDGNGINKVRVIEKAIENGLYTEAQIEKMSDNRIYNIIFESGFSTAEVVTAVSGRGVGMDMVKSSIDEMKGRIFIESEEGKGSKFVLVIPIPRSILIIKSLGILQNGIGYKIPLDDVAEVVHYEKNNKDAINEIEGALVLRHHDGLIPLMDYSEILGVEKKEHDFYNIVIVKGENYKYGLIVDSIEDIEEVVVKKLSHPLDKVDQFLGATFVGDGDLNLILNLEGIAAHFNLIDTDAMSDSYDEFFNKTRSELEVNEYMRFKIEEHDNYCFPLGIVNRLEVFDTKEVQFTGQNPIVKYRNGGLALKCVGKTLGLTERNLGALLSKEDCINVIVVNHAEHQYGLIIDEILEIEQSDSAIDDSIVCEDGILGTVFINEKIISVVDADFLINYSERAVNSFTDSGFDEVRDEHLEDDQAA